MTDTAVVEYPLRKQGWELIPTHPYQLIGIRCFRCDGLTHCPITMYGDDDPNTDVQLCPNCHPSFSAPNRYQPARRVDRDKVTDLIERIDAVTEHATALTDPVAR